MTLDQIAHKARQYRCTELKLTRCIDLINRTEEWVRPEPGPAKKDVVLVVITVVMFAIITAIHAWLGVWPFPG